VGGEGVVPVLFFPFHFPRSIVVCSPPFTSWDLVVRFPTFFGFYVRGRFVLPATLFGPHQYPAGDPPPFSPLKLGRMNTPPPTFVLPPNNPLVGAVGCLFFPPSYVRRSFADTSFEASKFLRGAFLTPFPTLHFRRSPLVVFPPLSLGVGPFPCLFTITPRFSPGDQLALMWCLLLDLPRPRAPPSRTRSDTQRVISPFL